MGILLFLGLGTGFVSSYLIGLFRQKVQIRGLEQEAHDIVQAAKKNEGFNREKIMHQMEEYKLRLEEKQESYMEKLLQNYREVKSQVDKMAHHKRSEWKAKEHKKDKKKEELKLLMTKVDKSKRFMESLKSRVQNQNQMYFQKLKQVFPIDEDRVKNQARKNCLREAKTQVEDQIRKEEESFKHNLIKKAHFILELALNRFLKPYCSERGIKNVIFPNKSVLTRVFGADLSGIKTLEKECGVDFKLSDETEVSVSVFGIDPVRRELGRACLQRIAGDRRFSLKNIPSLVQKTKRELFRRIASDGIRICRDLRLPHVKTEIKNMMGALRYRYSFAQNQHFHCEEVAWLCGMLEAELCAETGGQMKARRAGMMHDIGKAMDYSKEGGHAVIGADFIEKYGEEADVVYAVKAHHYDVTPENPLDFLVIAADALSGARPGARRSTEDSYNQKVLTLEKIGKSFEGVKDTYIMSAGREIRVIVDSKKVSDIQAVSLSKKIAGKIEEECSYPGLIKVTVVRTVTQSVGVFDRRTA